MATRRVICTIADISNQSSHGDDSKYVCAVAWKVFVGHVAIVSSESMNIYTHWKYIALRKP